MGQIYASRIVAQVREKKSGREGRREDALSIKCDNIELFCSHRTKNHHKLMLPSEIVNPNITLLYLWGFRSPTKASLVLAVRDLLLRAPLHHITVAELPCGMAIVCAVLVKNSSQLKVIPLFRYSVIPFYGVPQ